MAKEKAIPEIVNDAETDHLSGLILYNDEVNTFDFVIDSLIEVCKHEYEQAEQCALTAHLTGKCHVKSGDFNELKPMFEALTFRGLTVSIE
jgi:ATP-dependent Clp protease adaptor protein ClpS